MTLLWWAIFFGLNVAIEIGCIWMALRRGQLGPVALVGAVLVLFATPAISIALIVPMAQIDPNLHGGPGTGIVYAIPIVAFACLIAHVIVMLLTAGYMASQRVEAEREKKIPPVSR